jgi:predicted nucleic acid-binding protein
MIKVTALAKATPAITPIKPPTSVIVADSIRYCSITSRRRNPGSKLQRAEELERYPHEASSQIRLGKAATRAERRGNLSSPGLDYLLAAHSLFST